MRGAVRRFLRAGESIGERLEGPRRAGAREWNEHHVVSALRAWRTIPGPMKCDEGAAAIARREPIPRIEHERVRRPVGGEGRGGGAHGGASPDLAAVAAILRRQDQLALRVIVVTV